MWSALLAVSLLVPRAAAMGSEVKEAKEKEAKEKSAKPDAMKDLKAEGEAANETTIKLVQYFLKTPLAEANPTLVEPFLAVKLDTLPKKLRDPAKAKQFEIGVLLKLHDTKKKGSILMPDPDCPPTKYTYPRSQKSFFKQAGLPLADITEDEEKYLEDRTQCREPDLGCHFSYMIFYDPNPDPKKRKPRELTLFDTDPLMAMVAQFRQKGSAGTNFFGAGGILTCQH